MTLESAWSRIVDGARSDRAAIQAGARSDDDRNALALLDGTGDRTDAEAQGALAALLLGRPRRELLAYWLALGGPGFAIACATHERRFLATHPKNGAGLDLGTRWLEPRTKERVSVALDTDTWEMLHAAFRKLPKAEKESARDEVRAARTKAPPAIALYASTMALLGEESAQDVRALDGETTPEIDTFVIAALPALAAEPSPVTRAAAVAILERAGASAIARLGRHPKDIVRLLGPEGIAPLLSVLGAAHAAPIVDATAAKHLAEAVATLDTPEIASFFRRNVTSRFYGTVASAWITEREENPRAAKVHAEARAVKEERSKRAKKVAKKIATRKKREEVVAQAREATDDEIPWILREPPWRVTSGVERVPPLPEVAFVEAPFEEALHLSDSDREGIDADTEVDDDDPVGRLAQSGLAVVPALLAQPIAISIAGLRHVESPRIARWMLAALTSPRGAIARAYVRTYPRASAIALVDIALDAAAANRRAALECIASLLADHAEVVREACARYGDDVHDAVVAAARFFAPRGEAPSIAAWARDAKLPPVLVASGARLPARATAHLLEMCTFGAHPGLRELGLDTVSTDAWLVALLETWARARRADDWVLGAVASLGGPDAARALTAKAREWNRDRATRDLTAAAIEALGGGGRAAVVALVDLVRKGGALGDRASEALRDGARREGLSTDELADLAVPTLDLDEHGRASLDFGPRQFDIVLGDDLAPKILDREGRVVGSVRKLAADDPVKAQASLERLKSLKKSMAEVARNVASRLELAMIHGRTWRASAFEANLVAHPLLGRLVRRLVWARSTKGVTELFRIAEDGTAANAADELVTLEPKDSVRIPHVLELSADDVRTWGQILGDYEIIQPFPQLGRATFAPTEAERAAHAVTRFAGAEVKQMAIQGRLLARGWERMAGDGVTSSYVRRFKAITAQYILVDAFGFGEEYSNDTTLGSVTFGVPLERVPALVFSEVVYDLHVLSP